MKAKESNQPCTAVVQPAVDPTKLDENGAYIEFRIERMPSRSGVMIR